MTDMDAAALKALAFGLLQDRLKTADSANRKVMAEVMQTKDRKAVWVPSLGGSVIAGTVTLADGATYASVTDENALKAWIAVNRPDELTERTLIEIRPAFLDYLLSDAKKQGVSVDRNGEEIPGITVREGHPTIKVIRDKTPEAQAALVEAIFAEGGTGLRSLIGDVE